MTSRSFAAGRRLLRGVDARVGSVLSRQELVDPVFIVGCGRSGTTILGRVLAHHPQVTYLDERRDLWARAYPTTDIWRSRSESRGAQLVLTADDASPARSARLRRQFMWQTRRTGRRVLVEKLPANSFRLAFLDEVFPDARYVHLRRRGRQVAESIAREPTWYAKYRYRWTLLTRVARSSPETSELPDLCSTDAERALLEWRLSLDAIERQRAARPDRFLEVHYDDLVERPAHTVSGLLLALGLPPDGSVSEFARVNVARRHPPAAGPLSANEDRIVGDHARHLL